MRRLIPFALIAMVACQEATAPVESPNTHVSSGSAPEIGSLPLKATGFLRGVNVVPASGSLATGGFDFIVQPDHRTYFYSIRIANNPAFAGHPTGEFIVSCRMWRGTPGTTGIPTSVFFPINSGGTFNKTGYYTLTDEQIQGLSEDHFDWFFYLQCASNTYPKSVRGNWKVLGYIPAPPFVHFP